MPCPYLFSILAFMRCLDGIASSLLDCVRPVDRIGPRGDDLTLLLRRSEVADLLDLRQAMSVLEQTFREQSDGRVKQVPPLRFMNRGMRMVVGGLEAQDKNGFRVSVTGGESMAMLFEISSGKLLSLMGYPFSNLRISATVGLAVDRFANRNGKTVAMIGSGRLALPVLEPACAVRPIERVLVYSRSAEKRQAFARKASEALKISVTAVASAEQAIESAEMVLVSTNSPSAALCGKWLRPGVSVFGVGRPNEFDDDVYLRAGLICITSKTHELGYYDTKLDQPLIRLAQNGTISWDSITEFGDSLSEKISLPEKSNGIIVFRDSQGGYGDLALAAWAYDEAGRRGLGREISVE
jgi:ornithine cyclodeaminase/alanine dehydrogenase-like protein (mu-crystallin family)